MNPLDSYQHRTLFGILCLYFVDFGDHELCARGKLSSPTSQALGLQAHITIHGSLIIPGSIPTTQEAKIHTDIDE